MDGGWLLGSGILRSTTILLYHIFKNLRGIADNVSRMSDVAVDFINTIIM